jgi:3-oxoadipate enol-lactonase
MSSGLRAETHRVPVDGATLHVEVDGPEGAPALLLWNGARCTTHMWDAVVPRLADRFRVIRFDVRGTGQSTAAEGEEQYSFDRYAADAIALLERFGYEDSLVWSMAWGSRAALAYAGMHPERVRLLALYDASVGAADVAAQAAGREKAFAAQQAAGIPLMERPEGWNDNRDPETLGLALSAARKIDLPSFLPRVEAPTLVSTGAYDPNLESSRRIAEEIAGARLIVMENVGHGSVLQRPDLATEIFLEFVDEHETVLGDDRLRVEP